MPFFATSNQDLREAGQDFVAEIEPDLLLQIDKGRFFCHIFFFTSTFLTQSKNF